MKSKTILIYVFLLSFLILIDSTPTPPSLRVAPRYKAIASHAKTYTVYRMVNGTDFICDCTNNTEGGTSTCTCKPQTTEDIKKAYNALMSNNNNASPDASGAAANEAATNDTVANETATNDTAANETTANDSTTSESTTSGTNETASTTSTSNDSTSSGNSAAETTETANQTESNTTAQNETTGAAPSSENATASNENTPTASTEANEKSAASSDTTPDNSSETTANDSATTPSAANNSQPISGDVSNGTSTADGQAQTNSSGDSASAASQTNSNSSGETISKGPNMTEFFKNDTVVWKANASFRYLVPETDSAYIDNMINGSIQIGSFAIGFVDSTDIVKYALWNMNLLFLSDDVLITLSDYLSKFNSNDSTSRKYNPVLTQMQDLSSNNLCRLLVEYMVAQVTASPTKRIYAVCFTSDADLKKTDQIISEKRVATFSKHDPKIMEAISFHDLGIKTAVYRISNNGISIAAGFGMLLEPNFGIYSSPIYGESSSLVSGFRVTDIKNCIVDFTTNFPDAITNQSYNGTLKTSQCINYTLVVNTRDRKSVV